ncbi:MAG: hypothetical protein ACYCQJ_12945 [Nitrososphaerales archaeon]
MKGGGGKAVIVRVRKSATLFCKICNRLISEVLCVSKRASRKWRHYHVKCAYGFSIIIDSDIIAFLRSLYSKKTFAFLEGLRDIFSFPLSSEIDSIFLDLKI